MALRYSVIARKNRLDSVHPWSPLNVDEKVLLLTGR